MIAQQLLGLFERNLQALRQEVLAYGNEADIWKLFGGITNSAGTLVLHLTGNLNHFIGAVLGRTGYVRKRELEFSARHTPRAEMIAGLDQAAAMLRAVLPGLADADFEKEYPVDFQGRKTTLEVCFHLVAHFNYHLGQVNYHRRLISAS